VGDSFTAFLLHIKASSRNSHKAFTRALDEIQGGAASLWCFRVREAALPFTVASSLPILDSARTIPALRSDKRGSCSNATLSEWA